MTDDLTITVPPNMRMFWNVTNNTKFSTSYGIRWPERKFIPGVTVEHFERKGANLLVPSYPDEKIWQVFASYRPGVGYKPMGVISPTPSPDFLQWKLECWISVATGKPDLLIDITIS